MPGLDANMDTDPSDVSDLDVIEPVVADSAEPDAAASSPAPKDETDTELLSVARDAISKEREKSAPASSAADVVDDPDDGSDEPKKPDDEEFTDVPFHKHPRFQSLLRRSKANEVDAVRYRNVETFLTNTGVDGNEALEALTVAGLAKSNPAQAWERIKPWVQSLLVAAGEVLPNDLQSRVQNGEMSRDTALELSKARASHQSLANSQQFERSRLEQQAAQQQRQSVMDAAASWENDRRIKDPNYADKEAAIRKEVAYLQREEGIPTTPQGVRAQLKKAYDAANAGYRPPAPPVTQRPAVRPVVGGQVSGDQRSPAPKNTLDIIRAARNG